MSAYYELKPAVDQWFIFDLKAPNGEIILSSELYSSKDAALEGIEAVRTNSARDAQFERRKTPLSHSYFLLMSGSHEILGRSERYSTESACEKGIRSVMKNGPIAMTHDFT